MPLHLSPRRAFALAGAAGALAAISAGVLVPAGSAADDSARASQASKRAVGTFKDQRQVAAFPPELSLRVPAGRYVIVGKLTAILKEGAAMSCRLQAGSQFDEVRFGDVDNQIAFAERYTHAQPGSFTVLHTSTNSVTVTLDCLGGFLGTPGDLEDMKITAIPVDSFTNTPA